ncbi:MAG: hypothetical protein ABL984_04485 [Pyrinomonadaceae bacterium]
MWKLLSGIALIVLLDVAFIWMMAVEPDSPEIARAIGPTAAVPVIHEQQISEPVSIDDSTEAVIDDNFEVRDVRGSRSNRRGSGSTDRIAQPDTATVAATAPATLFQDTVIWIGRTEVPVKIDYREEIPVVVESRQEDAMQASIAPKAAERKKRSFESKAFSVIKKPYDWMKSAIDKLH